MKTHWVVFILFHLREQMDGVILMGTSQIQISRERGKNILIMTVFTRRSLQNFVLYFLRFNMKC